MSSQITSSIPKVQTIVNSTIINQSAHAISSVTNSLNCPQSIKLNGKRNFSLDTSSHGIYVITIFSLFNSAKKHY